MSTPGSSVRVALAGADGRMGRLCRTLLQAAPDAELAATLVRGDDPERILDPRRVDVLVDFTWIDASRDLVPLAIARGVRAVVGTSGWTSDALGELAGLCRRQGVGALVVPNFSVGAVLQMELAARVARHLPCTGIHEVHHLEKRDAPSGTARATADGIEAAGARRPAITSERRPDALARQEVRFGTAAESLVMTHEVTDRTAYGDGVLLAVRRVGELDSLVVGLAYLLGLGSPAGTADPA